MKKKSLMSNISFLIGVVLVAMMLLMVLRGWIATPYDPNAMDVTRKFASPSLRHFMGCDNFGRDVFSRILQGVGNTFIVSVGTVTIGAVFGILLGGLCGYYGGWLDEMLMRCNDVMFAFPSVFLALIVISLIGPGKYQVIVALGIAFIPSFARIVRSEFMKQRNRDYCLSAQLMGVSSLRVMFVHILPNAVPVILSSVIIGFNNAVLAEAGLSYLGIGVQPPEASLGAMLSDSQTFLYKDPLLCIFPGVVMALMILGFALMADGLGEKKHK